LTIVFLFTECGSPNGWSICYLQSVGARIDDHFSIYRVWELEWTVGFAIYRVWDPELTVGFAIYKVWEPELTVGFAIYRVCEPEWTVSFAIYRVWERKCKCIS